MLRQPNLLAVCAILILFFFNYSLLIRNNDRHHKITNTSKNDVAAIKPVYGK